jgi:AraC-like DNA-binding protein
LTLIRANAPTTLRRGVVRASVCIVVQGRKRVHLGKDIVEYAAGSYLASMINMPVAGQVIAATKTQPYLGVAFELAPREVASVLMEAKLHIERPPEAGRAAFVGQTDSNVLRVVLRSLEVLDDPRDAEFLAPSLKRELIYRLLRGSSGHLFHQSAFFDREAIGIGRAIEWLKDNFKRPLSIEDLAKLGNMSVSSLHHKFKAVTMMGPLQYQKRLRLEEARRLLMAGLADSTSAAFDVGYESPSQFNREYRRLFGLPPMRDVKAMRNAATRTADV